MAALAVAMAVLVAWPALAQRGPGEARLVQAPDGVLFVVLEQIRYRVTPLAMSEAELGAIPEGPPLPPGALQPVPSPSPTPGPQVIVPEPGVGLSRETAIPLGATCSCSIDRAGQVSQFDITIVRVLQDAYPFLQQANRFNRPPREGSRFVGILVDMKYIAGPEDQAYTVNQSDFHATAADDLLRDPLSAVDPEPRLQGDVYPGSTVRGWVFFELPRDQPAAAVWQTSFFGERGVWFALQ
jgi:hypothetical protein